MSAFKGTPGPWYWSPDYKTGDGRATWSLIGSDGYGILSCDGEENSPQGLSDGANAHLIAAAPELLEACQTALAFVAGWAGIYQHDHGLPDFHPRHKEAIEQVKYAIAKATGDQP